MHLNNEWEEAAKFSTSNTRTPKMLGLTQIRLNWKLDAGVGFTDVSLTTQ